MKVLGIDIGGSSLKGAPVDLSTGQLVTEPTRVETPKKLKPQQMADAVAEIAQRFKWRGPIGCGFPGVVRDGVTSFAGNLDQSFLGVNVDVMFRATTKRRVHVINDADAAGLAEVHFGAGRDRPGTLMMLTFGTGVGSGFFQNGHLIPNTELGYLPIRGRSAEKWVAASVKDKKKLSYREWGGRLNQYLQLVEVVLNPDLMIIGGGISADHAKWMKYVKVKTEVVPAALHNGAGIVGAALAFAR
jgi:polyphosphate glucokinase